MMPLAGMQTGAVEHTGGFEVTNIDSSNAQHFSNVNDAFAAAAEINASNNAQIYSDFFKNAADKAANADVGLDGGKCPEPCPWGSFTERPTTLMDKWESSTNIFAQASYSTVNSFLIVVQSLNPFDNQVTTLTGEGLNGTDRSAHGANVAATLLPVGGATGLKYSASNLKAATLNTLPTKQLFSLFKGKFRLERGVESIPRNIQRNNGIKLKGPVQKPWHFNILGKDVPVNPFNSLWRLYKK